MKRIILSRTDNLGDVILSLPMAGFIKKHLPDAKIIFLGKKYTRPVIEKSAYIDEFLDEQEVYFKGSLDFVKADVIVHVFPSKKIAKIAKQSIPLRIGTSHRFFHLLTCNKLVNLSRKSSNLHEAQLNIKLLRPLGLRTEIPENELAALFGWKKELNKSNQFSDYLDTEKLNLVFHIKSKGSAAEWPVQKFYELAKKLSVDKYNIILTGTEVEGQKIRNENEAIFKLPHVKDTTGKLQLGELIELISQCYGLLACSTGPLHIAAASGIHALGLYPNIRPMHAGRWGPIGEKAEVLESEVSDDYKNLKVNVDKVFEKISKWKS